ncbi:hypothetical protein EGR_09905 [Echinococcus granulosus]|uniref:Uncharacterized protein n=1 Tax=Echinococcus granulosus TaxID=6210 RepID=W6U9S0_ECHGR|nr:hypothetical protein EGR_09905 [Echinococcus granulosus]EUB55242.1 hypothetical protein EGR_09905 [Echinococcus granulosus]
MGAGVNQKIQACYFCANNLLVSILLFLRVFIFVDIILFLPCVSVSAVCASHLYFLNVRGYNIIQAKFVPQKKSRLVNILVRYNNKIWLNLFKICVWIINLSTQMDTRICVFRDVCVMKECGITSLA